MAMIKAMIGGYTFRAGALAFGLGDGNYDVYCCVCSGSLGTFTGDILMNAIMKSLDRGGVRCPECRKLTCQFCYVISEDRKPLTAVLFRIGEGKSEAMKVCSICKLELEMDPEAGVVITEYSGDPSEFVASYADADEYPDPGTPNDYPPVSRAGQEYIGLSARMDKIEEEWDDYVDNNNGN